MLGISGIAGGLARGAWDIPRVAFTAGLAGASALALPALAPTALQALSPSYTLTRALAAGALVGAGSALGGGCTSGHGICGNARLSARSAAFTGVMMAAGAASAALSGARAAVGLGAAATGVAGLALAPYASPAVGAVATGLRLLAVAVGTLGALALAGRARAVPPATAEAVSEAALGGLFALGLGVSGMLRPAKVVAFLTPLAPGGWDASLGLVMAGALAVSVPVFQTVLRKLRGCGGGSAAAAPAKPVCTPCFSLPTKSALDGRLLGGAALFGAGWGAGGICPGPGLVAVAAGAGGPYVPWVVAFLAAHALVSKAAGG